MELALKNFFGEIDLFELTSFLAWTFLNFLALCDVITNYYFLKYQFHGKYHIIIFAGWEERQDANGRTYYVNHVARTTQWQHPGGEGENDLRSEDQVDHRRRVHISMDETNASNSGPPSGGSTRPVSESDTSLIGIIKSLKNVGQVYAKYWLLFLKMIFLKNREREFFQF